MGAAALALSWMGLRASGDGESEGETQVRLDQFHQGPETIEQNTKTKERTMPVKLTERHDGKILEVQASGRLSHEDYRQFVPAFERLTKQHGKINVLFEMVDFHGWEAAALWDDLKFNLTHLSQIERLAMVGNKKWEQGMANFCAPFTHADVRFFDPTQFADARDWLGIPPML